MEKGVIVSMAKLKKRVKAGKKLPTIKQFEISDYWGYEQDREDLPYYNDRNYSFDLTRFAVFNLFLFLGVLTPVFGSTSGIFSVFFRIAFSLILYISGYIYMFGGAWKDKFFKKPKELLPIIIFLFLTLVSGSVLFYLLNFISDVDLLSVGEITSVSMLLTNILSVLFQVIGEELFAVGLFMGILIFGNRMMSLDRKPLIIFSLMVSSLLFGLLHLPVYNYNLLQCLFVIGLTRLIMTVLFFMKRNIVYSYIVHVLYNIAILVYAYYV